MSINKKKPNENYNFFVTKGINKATKLDFNESKINFFNAIKINPKKHEAFINLSNIYLIQKNFDECLNLLFDYLSKNKFNEQISNHLAKICINYDFNHELDKLFKIINLDDSIIEKKKQFLFFIQGQHFENQEMYSKAINSYAKSVSCDSSFFKSYIKIFDLYENTNNIIGLEKYIKLASKKFKDKEQLDILLLYKCLLLNRQKKYSDSEYLINRNKIKLKFKNNNNFLIKILDVQIKNCENLNDYKNAFNSVKERNSLVASLDENKKYNKLVISNTIKNYKKFFTKSNFHKVKNKLQYHDDKNLVFLVGFPRSGTTLLDTILRSHSKIKVLEERPFLLELRHKFFNNKNNDLTSLLNITQNEKDEIRSNYFDKIITKKNDKDKIIIDKLPLSIIELGFIKFIFPKSKIIFSMRHPADVVISCYFSSFKINDAMVNFLQWKDTLNFYDQVLDLFEFYDKELELNYFLIKYENIVNSFEKYIKELISYLNLEYEKNLENFYITAQKRNKISTPSYDQVIQPLYTKSIGRWKNYSKYLNSQTELKKWVAKYNY